MGVGDGYLGAGKHNPIPREKWVGGLSIGCPSPVRGM